MSKSGYDTFALVINFIKLSWIPCHITIGQFEARDTSGATLTKQVKILLVEFNLKNKVIMYVKDEGANLKFLTITLTFIVSCKPLQLPQPFANVCFGQVMSKACQYVMNETKVGVGMKEVSLKDVQVISKDNYLH